MSRPAIEYLLNFVIHGQNNNSIRYTREELLGHNSDSQLPAGLAVLDGLLAARFKAAANGQSGIRALVVLNKDLDPFTAEDQAILGNIGTFISLFSARAHPGNHARGNYQLIEMINSIPGFIAKGNHIKRTDDFEVAHSKLKDKMEENAARMSRTMSRRRGSDERWARGSVYRVLYRTTKVWLCERFDKEQKWESIPGG